MLILDFSQSDNKTVFIKEGDIQLGTMLYEDVIPEAVLDGVGNILELDKLKELAGSEENVHLRFISIYDDHRCKDHFRSAMAEFENLTLLGDRETITLVSKVEQSRMFKALGYSKLAYIPTSDSYVMIKNLTNWGKSK